MDSAGHNYNQLTILMISKLTVKLVYLLARVLSINACSAPLQPRATYQHNPDETYFRKASLLPGSP